jgi:hypothetical protein
MFFKRLGPIKIFFNYPNLYLYCCIALAIIMNIFILLGFTTRNLDGTKTENLNNINLFFILDSTSKVYH